MAAAAFFEIVFSFPLAIYPEIGFLDHVVVPFLIFSENFILFSIATVPICVPIIVHEGADTPSPTRMSCLFEVSQAGMRLILHCGFEFNFTDDY